MPLIFYSTTHYANRIEPTLYRVRGLEAQNLAIVHEAIEHVPAGTAVQVMMLERRGQ